MLGVVNRNPERSESLEFALRKFKRKVDQSGLMREVQLRSEFEKPSDKKRRKRAEARSRK